MNLDNQETMAESENFIIWRSEEEDGFLYHVELGAVTLHLTPEEWDELVVLFKEVS